MRTPLVAVVGLALALPTAGASAADGPGDGRGSPPWFEARFERRTLGGSLRLVVNADRSVPAVAACLAGGEGREIVVAEDAELAHRGGTVSEQGVDAVRVTCLEVPAGELAFALHRIRGALRDPESVATPEEGAGARLREIAREGMRGPEGAPWTLVVTGNTTADEAIALASGQFGRAAETAPGAFAAWSPRQTTERLSVLEGDVATPHVLTGWTVPDAGAAESAALAVAFDVLAGTSGARLPQSLPARGLTRRVETFRAASPGGSLLGIALELTSPASPDRARRFVDGSVKQLRLVGPSTKEVRRARAHLELAAAKAWERLVTRAALLAVYELARGDARRFAEEARALGSVTPESVRRATYERLVDARRTTVETFPRRWPLDDPRVAHHTLYTIEQGDTLASLAERFGTTVAKLARANDLDPRYRLVPGQPLWVPPRMKER